MNRNDFSPSEPPRFPPAYLSSLQVEASLCGFNTVGNDWRDLNYTPGYSKFYYILSGEGLLEVSGRSLSPRAGQIALMPEGTLQSYRRTEGAPYRKYWCHFTARIGRTSLFDLVELPLVIDVPPDDAPRLEAWFQLLLDHRDGGPWAGVYQKAAVLGLVAWYGEHCPVLKPALGPDSPQFRLQRCLDFIEANLHRPLGLEELAETVHWHPAYFARVFKKHGGMAPLQYVRTRRLEEARRLLAIPSLTLKQIGERVGIDNPFYLSRLFKAHTGFSPSQYRSLASG